jgi:hypothetical protein
MINKKLENSIKSIQAGFDATEETDYLYMGKAMQRLRHHTMYIHSRIEQSLETLIIQYQLKPIEEISFPKEARQSLYQRGIFIISEIPFTKKLELAKNNEYVKEGHQKRFRKVNNLRIHFSHPTTHQQKLDKLKTNRENYHKAYKELEDAKNALDEIFKI